MLLTIEKLIYGGDGLARLPADEQGRGKAVFVPYVLPGENVEATLAGQKPGFARARLTAIVEPSAQRIDPGCQYFTACGGCHYQHTSYEHQLEIKKEILRENLRRGAKLELEREIQVHPSPPWNYRNRSRLQVRTKPNFAAGYFKPSSHQVQPVEQCPISSPLINRGIAALWTLGQAGKIADGIREVEFFANADDSQLLIELLSTAEARRAEARSSAEDLRAALPEIAGVVVFRDAQQGVKSPSTPDPLVVSGERYLTYKTGDKAYRVGAGAFFQTNRHLVGELLKIVTQGRSGESALDLYAGVGLFSTGLACDFRHIDSVESSQTSFSDLSYNLPSNGKAIQATTEMYLPRRTGSGRERSDAILGRIPPYDFIVVDPPRSGLGERVTRSLVELGAPRVAYVSCDPATLARDLRILLESGYRVDEAHLVDLFPQTFHLETVLHLVR